MSHQIAGEHGTVTLNRLLAGLAIPRHIEHSLLTLVNSLELAKAQLKGHLAQRNNQIKHYRAPAASHSNAHALELTQVRASHAMESKTLKDELAQARTSHALENKALKDELAQAHADHELETQRLGDELEQARRGYSGDDDLVKLYHAGATLVIKQAADIKKLQAEGRRGKDEQEQQNKESNLMMKEKDEEKAVLVYAVQELERRLASVTTEFMDTEMDLKRQVEEVTGQLKAAAAHSSKLEGDLKRQVEEVAGQLKTAAARSSKLEGDVVSANKTIDDLRRRESAEGEKAKLLNRLHKVEQHCEDYRSTATDQQKLIEKLSKENAKLVSDLGKLHLHRK